MKIYRNPGKKELKKILARPVKDHEQIEKIVKPILEKVRRGGDHALRKFALEYDHVSLDDIWVSTEELDAAKNQVDDKLKDSIAVAMENIHRFHEAQKQEDLEMEVMEGVFCSRKSVAIENVGLYVPGGTAPLFSTVLMLGIPAKIAGCKQIILASPTDRIGQLSPEILYAANAIGIHKILKIGGAQAIAGLAYGTESVPKVDKIFGPGNQYVTAAKQLAAKDAVAIDMPAGPSEVMVVIDKEANPDFAAADLLSQAEHGVDSQVILVTSDEEIARKTQLAVSEQLKTLPRKQIAQESLSNSAIIVLEKEEGIINAINDYGPEHLIINTTNAESLSESVRNAGSVFIGPYTPESAGDYASGTNHTLPTNGWAKAYSGVSLDSFVKKITYQKITKKV